MRWTTYGVKDIFLMVKMEQRLKEFVRRLIAAPAVGSDAEAFSLVEVTLNNVENELTQIPFDPSNWRNDGRMYPPQMDSARDVDGHPTVTRYRTKKHNVFIRTNGSIRIEERESKSCVLSKPGKDGKEVWQK